jgi:predicted dehydrogenase
MTLHLALLGCGAIAQGFYLPALARRRSDFGNIWLVDPGERALKVASSMIDGKPVQAMSEVSGDISLAIIAAPNKLHCPLAHESLARRAHVLVEKPFAIWPEEGETLIDAAATAGRVLAVNQTRRFMPYARDLRRRIAAGEFGAFRSARHYEGQKLSWPFESGAAFHRTSQRTGVIMDLGVHVIDFYQYLLTPEWKIISAIHDGFRGPEGLAEIRLEANGAPIEIRLSRYHKQENVAHLMFDRVEIEINLDGLNSYKVREKAGSVEFVTVSPMVPSYEFLADDVLANFVAAARGQADPVCAASASIPVIRTLDAIYHSVQLYPAKIGAI